VLNLAAVLLRTLVWSLGRRLIKRINDLCIKSLVFNDSVSF